MADDETTAQEDTVAEETKRNYGFPIALFLVLAVIAGYILHVTLDNSAQRQRATREGVNHQLQVEYNMSAVDVDLLPLSSENSAASNTLPLKVGGSTPSCTVTVTGAESTLSGVSCGGEKAYNVDETFRLNVAALIKNKGYTVISYSSLPGRPVSSGDKILALDAKGNRVLCTIGVGETVNALVYSCLPA